jgi:argininosuccinate lyase
LFDAADTVEACLAMAAPVVAGARLRRESIAKRLDRGYLDATALMEHLIQRGIPQRSAHHLVGKLVAEAMRTHVPLADLPLEQFREAEPTLDERVYDVLGAENAVDAMKSYGSTAPTEVARQIKDWKNRLGCEST